MSDFEEEAKQILTAEWGRAATDARYDAAFDGMVLGLVVIGILVLDKISSGPRISWKSDLEAFALVYPAALVALWMNARFAAFRKMRDARLIRIELKLDRWLERSSRDE